MDGLPQEITACHDHNGNVPFEDWLDALSPKTQAVVMNRIDRVERGLFGDVKPVGEGVSELRIDFGPGYRVYFGQIGNQVHLISGGSKPTQDSDIAAAKKFWNSHD